jgi:hypothetical protein
MQHFAVKFHQMDPVKLAYLRTSFVFAISVLVTWTPSSINRVYTLVYPQRFNYGLNVASAVVLPLQGVWNTVIYCATSWLVLREEIADLVIQCSWLPRGVNDRAKSFSSERRPTYTSERLPRTISRPIEQGHEFELCVRPSNLRVAKNGSF